MPEARPPAAVPGSRSRVAAASRHLEPAIDDAALVAARRVDLALADARARGAERWARFLEPLPDLLRDEPVAGLRSACMRARAAFGPKDSIRDALSEEVTEPLVDALDRLLKALNRRDVSPRDQ